MTGNLLIRRLLDVLKEKERLNSRSFKMLTPKHTIGQIGQCLTKIKKSI